MQMHIYRKPRTNLLPTRRVIYIYIMIPIYIYIVPKEHGVMALYDDVCKLTYMRVYMCIHTYKHTHIYIYINVYTYIYVYIYI